jgi:hypothetical protein
MSERLDPLDVLDLSLVEISGQKLTSLLVPRARLELSLAMSPLDGDAHRSRVAASVRTFALIEGVDDNDESNLLYEGSVAYVIQFVDDGPDDVTLEGPPIVQFVWPYLRMGLIEQASRLGSPLQLPLEIDESTLVPTETSSGVAEAPVE